MAKYEKITRYAGRLAEDPGNWTKPVNRGNRLALPEFEPSEAMGAFVNDFLADYWPELQDYAEILGEVGIDPVYSSTADFDMGALDSRVVLALLTASSSPAAERRRRPRREAQDQQRGHQAVQALQHVPGHVVDPQLPCAVLAAR